MAHINAVLSITVKCNINATNVIISHYKIVFHAAIIVTHSIAANLYYSKEKF